MRCLPNNCQVVRGAASSNDFCQIGRPLRSAVQVLAVLTVLAGCGSGDGPASPGESPAAVATAASGAALASAHPLCSIATPAEVQQAIGGNINKVDVIDEESLHQLSCLYLDSQDLYNSLALIFVTDERLAKTASQWSDAGTYYAEWSRGGTPVTGLGDAASWSAMPAGLYVLKGKMALHFGGGKSDFADAAVRSKFEALARQVVARLP